jgi:hypothetical protein
MARKCSCGRDVPRSIEYATRDTQATCPCGAMHLASVITATWPTPPEWQIGPGRIGLEREGWDIPPEAA